jgi:hypothetical protein
MTNDTGADARIPEPRSDDLVVRAPDRDRGALPQATNEAEILATEALRMVKGGDADHTSAEELLADWRSAERDSVAAHNAASVAARAVSAAATAEEAALEAESAAREATDAAARAKEAAERAKTAASQAALTAQQAADTTEDDQAKADQTALDADHAEGQARDRFHAAQDDGFPKD